VFPPPPKTVVLIIHILAGTFFRSVGVDEIFLKIDYGLQLNV
jgi:hypothetical protein